MKNILLKTTGLTMLSACVVMASGWRIPEQSANSVALSGAYVANANGAEASYYNPANMSFNENKSQAEVSAMYIHLTSIKYKDNRSSTLSGDSKEENFFIPTFFMSSKDYDGLRYGLSFTAPGGLSKRWDETHPKKFAEEFSLRIVELNPVMSYKVADNFSIGGGLRMIYSDGVVKSDAPNSIKREMEGDTIEYGYNLALAYKPTPEANISATYRSRVDIKEEGNAKLYYNGTKFYDGGASVEVPLPAVLALATSYDFGKATLEFEYEKTYWSDYKALDFEYSSAITTPNPLITSALVSAFDDPKAKNWKDTDTYRIGLTYEFNEKFTGMLGFAIDENPAPSDKLGYELPDSDAKLYSIGGNYKLDDMSSIGFGYLLDVKEKRTVVTDDNAINGEFSDAKAHLVSFAYRMSF